MGFFFYYLTYQHKIKNLEGYIFEKFFGKGYSPSCRPNKTTIHPAAGPIRTTIYPAAG